MRKQIYKWINDGLSNFKNTCFDFLVIEQIALFIKHNPIITNLAQLQEFIRLLQLCATYNMPLQQAKLQVIIYNQTYLYQVLCGIYKHLPLNEISSKILQDIVLQIWIDNKELILSTQTLLCKQLIVLKEALDKQNDAMVWDSLNAVVKHLHLQPHTIFGVKLELYSEVLQLMSRTVQTFFLTKTA